MNYYFDVVFYTHLNKADRAIGLVHAVVDYLASPPFIQESSDGNPLLKPEKKHKDKKVLG